MITLLTGGYSFSINRLASQQSRFSKGLSGMSSSTFSSGIHLGARNGIPFVRGSLVIDLLSKEDADLVREFFYEKVRFGTGYFGLLSDKSDLGRGVNSVIYGCTLDGEASTGIYIYKEGSFNKYTAKINYFYWDNIPGGHGTR